MNRSPRWLALAAALVTVTATQSLAPAEAWAQRRAVRRPAVRPVVRVARPVRTVYYRPAFYRPYHYAPYVGFYGNWYSGGWYGYPGPSPYYWQRYPYGYYYRGHLAEARIQVEPREAEVFIDGYFVGIVDDFDGWSQRLRIEPGERLLEIHLEGYQTYRQDVLFRPGSTLKIEDLLQPLPPGAPQPPRPTPSQGVAQPYRGAPPAGPPPSSRAPGPRPPRESSPVPPRGEEPQEYGAIAVRVRPFDAEVLVDGQRWVSPDAGDLTIQLVEGIHRLEVRRQGFRPYTAEIQVRRGETTTLNVSLSR